MHGMDRVGVGGCFRRRRGTGVAGRVWRQPETAAGAGPPRRRPAGNAEAPPTHAETTRGHQARTLDELLKLAARICPFTSICIASAHRSSALVHVTVGSWTV